MRRVGALKPVLGARRYLSLDGAHARAQRVMLSPLGQEALRDGWGRMLWQHVFDKGGLPSSRDQIDFLKSEASKADARLVAMQEQAEASGDACPVTGAWIRLLERRQVFEQELRDLYFRQDDLFAGDREAG